MFLMQAVASGNGIMSIPFNFLFWADKVPGNNGDPITTWEDIKGGYDAVSPSAVKPTLTKNIVALNGHSALTFATAQAFQNATFTAGQPRTIIAVWNATLDGHDNYLIDGAEYQYQSSISWRNATPDYMRVYSEDTHLFDYARALPSSYIITMADLNGANSYLYEGDPTTPVDTGDAGTADMHGITLGIRYDLNNITALTGHIALAGCVDGGLDAAGKMRAYQILSEYYGIS
jgi:hypothetical protein